MSLKFRMNLCPKLHMLQCLLGLFRPLFVEEKKKKRIKMNRPLLDLSASPQVNIPTTNCMLLFPDDPSSFCSFGPVGLGGGTSGCHLAMKRRGV